MTASQLAARLVYVPRVSSYLSWWGGLVGVTLAIIALLQFAYHLPRPRYPREARIVLILSSIITGALWAWTAWDVITAWPHYVASISVELPTDAVTDDVTLIYTPVPSPTKPLPGDLQFPNHAFTLEVYDCPECTPLAGLCFQAPDHDHDPLQRHRRVGGERGRVGAGVLERRHG